MGWIRTPNCITILLSLQWSAGFHITKIKKSDESKGYELVKQSIPRVKKWNKPPPPLLSSGTCNQVAVGKQYMKMTFMVAYCFCMDQKSPFSWWWKMVEVGGRWWKVMKGGGKWCKVVEDDGRWWKMVDDGGCWWNMVVEGSLCSRWQLWNNPCGRLFRHWSYLHYVSLPVIYHIKYI